MASLTITFKSITDSKSGNVSIELDDEKNNGKTEFMYGEKAYFRVFADPGMSVSVLSTDGAISNEGAGVSTETELKEFVEKDTAETSKAIEGIVSHRWLGQDLGNITKSGIKEIKSSQKPDIANGKIGMAEIKYTAHYKRYALSVGQKNEAEYSVLVVVVGTTNG